MAVHALESVGPGEAGPLMPSDAEPDLAIATELRKVLGPKGRVIWRGAELDLYSRDQADIPESLRRMLVRTTPDAVVQPETVEDVAHVVSAAYGLGVPIVPRGAASFPLGGSVPTMGGVVIDLSALRRVLAIDKERILADVEAGVRWSTLQEVLRGDGLTLRTYPSSWFSTVGGWVATGGYGINSLKFGHLSKNVRALQVVTPTGGVEWVDEGDPDFSLYFGTEGQLGLVTRVVLKVRLPPKSSEPRLVQFKEAREAFDYAKNLLAIASPTHILYFDPHRMHTFNRLMEEPFLREAHSLLIHIENGVGAREAMEIAAARGASIAPRHHGSYLWRERFFPLKPKRLGPGMLGCELMFDHGAAPAAFERWHRIATRAGVDPELEAHFIDGGRVLGLCTWLTDPRQRWAFTLHAALSVRMALEGIKFGGIPYGTGIWQAPLLADRFGKDVVHRLREEKERRDPKGLLNPGKFFRVTSRYGNVLGLAMSPRLAKLGMAIAGPFLPWLARRAYGPPEDHGDALERSTMECSACGACIPVCPAYLATNSEMVTGRGKLQVAARLLKGEAMSAEDAQSMFLCIHCGACERVCQSELPLVAAYDELEGLVARGFGLPEKRIEAFSKRVQDSDEYRQLLGAGMVTPAFYTYKDRTASGGPATPKRRGSHDV
jgi:FAD/FMN-containing dehydrogenase/NAD-dependent dihydropyrimidine dehydrogenase PreA subunit